MVSVAVLLASCFVYISHADDDPTSYYSKLRSIDTSVGAWEQPFDPDRHEYEIQLGARTESVIVEYTVDFSHYLDESDWPLLVIDGKTLPFSKDRPASKTILFDKSPYAQDVDISVSVIGPRIEVEKRSGNIAKTVYKVRFKRAPDLDDLLTLAGLVIENEKHQIVHLQPPFQPDSRMKAHDAFVEPTTKKVMVTPTCDVRTRALVDGRDVLLGQSEWVLIDQKTAHTIVTVACAYGVDKRTVVIDLQELADLDAVAAELQLQVLGGQQGVNSVTRVDNDTFLVESSTGIVELVPVLRDVRVAMKLLVPGEGTYALRMGVPSVPLNVPSKGNKTLTLLLRSLESVRRLTVVLKRFVRPSTPRENLHSTVASVAGICAFLTAAGCLFATGLVAAIAAATGLGSARGRASAAALRTLTLLLQFVALGNVVSGRSFLTDFAYPLRFLTMFPTRPLSDSDGIALIIQSGDAAWCLLAVSALLVSVSILHLVFLAACVLLGGCRYTLPHFLCFGALEAHMLLHLTFPAACAATLVLVLEPAVQVANSGQSQTVHIIGERSRLGLVKDFVLSAAILKVSAIVTLVLPLLVALVSAFRVWRALRTRRVAWISCAGKLSRSELRGRRGHLPRELGYFRDVVCDQLSTRMVKHAPFGSAIPLRWVSTVADIRPVKLLPGRGFGCSIGRRGTDSGDSDKNRLADAGGYVRVRVGDAEDDENGTNDEQGEKEEKERETDGTESDRGPSEVSSSLGAIPPTAGGRVNVEVVSTVRPVCAHRLLCCQEVGRFNNVEWLEALLSADSLLRLHQEVEPQLHEWATPLSVLPEQLQGPLTNGSLSFCFDGFRWPHLAPLELVLRVSFGVLTAAAIVEPRSRALALTLQGVLSGGIFAVLLQEVPSNTFLENALLLLGHLSLAFTALSYLAYVAGVFSADVCSAVVVVIMAGSLPPLLLYAVLTTLLLASAAACPAGALEEAEALETCNVDLGLRGPDDQWLLLVPAACKIPVTDVFVHTLPCADGTAEIHTTGNFITHAKPRLEFPVLDYLALSRKLEPPMAVLVGFARGNGVGAGATGFAGSRAEAIYFDESPLALAEEFVRRGPAASVPYASEISAEVLHLVRQRATAHSILVIGIVPVPRLVPLRREDDENGYASSADGSSDEREALVGFASKR